jgi:hypothetical protein
MRRLLKLGATQPENYHQKCFIDALLGEAERPGRVPAELLSAQKATFDDLGAGSRPWIGPG